MPTALTNIIIKKAKSKEKPYQLIDGRGMYLLVHPNGSKYWRMKYYTKEYIFKTRA